MKLHEIPKGVEFTGYYWLANSHRPEILKGEAKIFEEIDGIKDKKNYIQEAFFRDKETAYSIKHFDGTGHMVSSVRIDDIDEKTSHSYLADPALIRSGNDRALDIKTLSFVQEWVESPDELCEKMGVLKPGRIAFVGFNKEENND